MEKTVVAEVGGDRSEVLTLLRESVRDAAAAQFPGTPAADDWCDAWLDGWGSFTELGLWATIVPPDGSLATALVVAEELGRALYPGPACETLAAALVGSRLGWDVESAVLGVGSGAARMNPMVASPNGAAVWAVVGDRVVQCSPAQSRPARDQVRGIDVTRRLIVPAIDPDPQGVLEPDVASAGRQALALLYCADTLGCVDRVLAATIAYAKQRHTFGSAIGAYQAVAHRLVDHAVTVEQMRLLMTATAEAFDAGAVDLDSRCATVETFFARHAAAMISDCIQLCGGIGFTWEWGHHFFLRRVVQNSALTGGNGGPARRLAQVATW